MGKTTEALRIETRLRAAVREGVIDRAPGEAMAYVGQAVGVITQTELEVLHAADEARADVIRLDDFDAREYPKLRR